MIRVKVCGCGRDYLTVPLEEAHECPQPQVKKVPGGDNSPEAVTRAKKIIRRTARKRGLTAAQLRAREKGRGGKSHVRQPVRDARREAVLKCIDRNLSLQAIGLALNRSDRAVWWIAERQQ